MDIGSAEHKRILMTNIVKISVKIATLSLILGGLLMIPSIIRLNAFSTGLFYLGTAIVLVGSLYSIGLFYKKYQAIIKPFNDKYPMSEINDER